MLKKASKKIFSTALYTMCAGRSKAKFKPCHFPRYFKVIFNGKGGSSAGLYRGIVSVRILIDTDRLWVCVMSRAQGRKGPKVRGDWRFRLLHSSGYCSPVVAEAAR